MKQDCIDNYLVLSDRINYKDNLMVEVIHDADSKLVTQKIQEVKMPLYLGDEIKADPETEKALQAVLGTEDKISVIIDKLKKFGENRTLRLWTPSEGNRKSTPQRAVGLYFSVGEFGVGCSRYIDGWDDDGCSRGVINSAAKQQSK
jgi:hypothetical protein